MPDNICIRPARSGDGALILTLIRELAEYERLFHEVVASEESIDRWLFGERPAAEALIAEWDGAPTGFALFFHNFSTFVGKPGIYLEDLYVRPQWRGKGIGGALLREVARLADQRGCGRLEWAVLDWNDTAVGFYQSLGAKPMSDWTVFRLTEEGIRRLAQAE